jgi:hypothetical protein
MFIPWLIYWLVTLQGSLNIGIRHLFPTLPFVFLFIARTVFPIFNPKPFKLRGLAHAIPKYTLLILGIWFVFGSVLTYPSYLSYFNELTIGKPKYDFLVDSNLDWGQDLKRLAQYVDSEGINKIKIDYFGGGVPSYYIDRSKIINWHSDQGPATGWFAISATFFQFSKMYGVQEGKWDYSWLESFEPERVIGNSILVFNISQKDLVDFPPVHLAPEIKVSPEEAEKERTGSALPETQGLPSVQGQIQGVTDYIEKTRH